MRERIDRYEIEGVIGHGSMGVVYRARDPVIGRELAVKTIRLSESACAASPEAQERFARELRAAGVLSHPNIVTVYDAGNMTGDSTAYMAMEYVEGRSLRERIRPGERMRSEDALDLAMQVARALDYAHSRGIVHRDVKPGNILIRDDGLAKLADFGIARFGPSDVTQEGGSIGSPAYIAPEVLRGEAVDGRSDLFSLGVVLYEVLTGVRPFQSETLPGLYHQILSAAPVPPGSIGHEMPPEWNAVIMKLLAKRPSERYAHAGELLEDLRRLERGMPPLIAASVDHEATLTMVEPLPASSGPRLRAAKASSTADGSHDGNILVSAAPLALFGVVVAVAIFLFDRPGSAVTPPAAPPAPAAQAVALPPDPPPAAPAPEVQVPVAIQQASSAPSPPQRAALENPAPGEFVPDPSPQKPVSVSEPPLFVIAPLDDESEPVDAGPATLMLTFEHTLEEGRFTLLLDGETMVSEAIDPLEGRRRSPPRSFFKSLSVGGGHHAVVAIVEDQRGRQWREASDISVESGRTASLSVALRGLKKRLRIELQD